MSGWAPPRAVGANVLVVPVKQRSRVETILGRQRVVWLDEEGDGTIATGREVERHLGEVVAVGPWVAREHPELVPREPGPDYRPLYVVWQRARQNEFVWQGVRYCVLSMRTHCPMCRHELHADEVLGVSDAEASAEACGGCGRVGATVTVRVERIEHGRVEVRTMGLCDGCVGSRDPLPCPAETKVGVA